MRPCFGAVVGARRIRRRVQEAHRDLGADDAPDDPDRERAVGAAAEAPESEDDQGPEQVELLFDRQRPEVVQRQGIGEQIEVRLPGADEVPVREVEDARDRVAPQCAELRLGDRVRRVQADDGQHDEQRGQQAAGAPGPESGQRYAAGGAALREEERRDQETGEDEERVDAEEPALSPRVPEVIGDDRADRERARARRAPVGM